MAVRGNYPPFIEMATFFTSINTTINISSKATIAIVKPCDRRVPRTALYASGFPWEIRASSKRSYEVITHEPNPGTFG
jgi:hypothetical protein